MSDSKIDYVNPFGLVAKNYKSGLDAIVASIGSGGPGTVDMDTFNSAVYTYLTSIYTNVATDLQGEEALRAIINNSINGFLDNGSSSPYLQNLLKTPPNTLSNQFDRLFDASAPAAALRGNRSRHQLILSVGEASVDYWIKEISTGGAWSPYLSGDKGIDTAAMPFYTDAAMFGAYFSFYQNNANDSEAVVSSTISALAGSLAVGAGKVVFGWVPKCRPANCDCSGVSSVWI